MMNKTWNKRARGLTAFVALALSASGCAAPTADETASTEAAIGRPGVDPKKEDPKKKERERVDKERREKLDELRKREREKPKDLDVLTDVQKKEAEILKEILKEAGAAEADKDFGRYRELIEQGEALEKELDARQATLDTLRKAGTPLTEGQKESLRFYTGTGYEAINVYLRTGEAPFGYEAAELDKHIKNLDAAIAAQANLPKEPVYRGIDGDAPKSILDLKVGDKFKQDGFSSTTKDTKTADEFTNGNGIALKILNPEAAKGVDAKNAYESSEILLQRGLNFEVVEVISDPAALKKLGFPYAPKLVVVKIIP